MVPRAEYISSIWTRLFLSLSSIRHHVLREREIDKSSNIKLLEFPKLSEDIVEIAKSLRNDTKIHGLDGPIVEYIIQNDVLDTLVSLAQEDIPDGLLILMVGLYSALLSTLPPAFFLNDRVAAPLRALLRSIEGSFKHEDSFERIVYLLDILGEQTQKLPDLIKVIIPDDMSMRTLYNIFKYIIDTNVNLFGLKEAILKGLSSGLIGGPEGEEVILSIVFGLIRVFSMGPSGQFIELFQFIQQCLDASRSDDAVPSLLMTAYRDYFVDRVFTTTFSGRSTKDNSLGILLDILLNLGEEPKCSELYLPLLSRTIRLLERNESGTEASNIELYGQALWSRMQWRCFPLKRPEKWTESISIHRQRLASCLSLLPSLGLEIFDSAVLVSNFYRIHLLSIERVLGEDLSVISHDKNSFPVIRHERTVFDATKTANLAALFSKIKRELSKLWTIAAKPNLMMSKFLVGCILFFDSVHFYGELNEDDPSSLLSVIKSLVSHCPEVIPDEDILERMIEFHTKHDFWDLRRWDPIMFVNDAVVQRTANAYILGNMIMRLSACIQVRSTKESTVIIYD